MKTFRDKKQAEKLIDIFANSTGCCIQHDGCPCNTCFHSLKGDFKHIVWLILLGLRGDYDSEDLLESIKREIK